VNMQGQDWATSNQGFKQRQDKQVYYFSLEFLIGRLLGNNLLNVNELELVRDSLAELGFSLEEIEEQEADAGLGNGGLGRLAACFPGFTRITRLCRDMRADSI